MIVRAKTKKGKGRQNINDNKEGGAQERLYMHFKRNFTAERHEHAGKRASCVSLESARKLGDT